MLRSVGAYILAAVLLVVSGSSFQQVLSEFRDSEPGSLLFGVLHLIIGTSAVAGSIGLIKRAPWTARSIAISGFAAVALLVSQPLFEPTSSDAKWSIGLGAALIAAVATGGAWFARRLARHDAARRIAEDAAHTRPPTPEQLPYGRRRAEPIVEPAPDAVAAQVVGRQRSGDRPEA